MDHKTVEIGVCGTLNINISAAHIVQSVIVKAEGTFSVLEEIVSREYLFVRIYNGS